MQDNGKSDFIRRRKAPLEIDEPSEPPRRGLRPAREITRDASRLPSRPAPVAVTSTPAQDAKGENAWDRLQHVRLGAQTSGRLVGRSAATVMDTVGTDPIAKGFDLLRTRLVRTIRAYGWKQIAVVAPTSGCGATFTAANLALSLARVPLSRTVLMDFNQRDPGLAKALGVRNPPSLDAYLSLETPLERYMLRNGDTLALGLSDTASDFAAEVLHDPMTHEVLDEMMDALRPELVIYDMPPMLVHDDLAAFLPRVDGVLLVADGTQTTPEHIAACERILEDQTQLLGVVLNRGRSDGDKETMI
jgi:Mrp family chromosome partitioning ATPase